MRIICTLGGVRCGGSRLDVLAIAQDMAAWNHGLEYDLAVKSFLHVYYLIYFLQLFGWFLLDEDLLWMVRHLDL